MANRSVHRLDIVVVEPEGWEPEGFGIELCLIPPLAASRALSILPPMKAACASLARDVDGIGDDLDLIIKSARSLAPVGVWLNDHCGGFTSRTHSYATVRQPQGVADGG